MSARPFNAVNLGPSLIYVSLKDGRTYHVPRSYTPRLAAATTAQLRDWEFIGDPPVGVRWPALDEDIGFHALGAYLRD